MQVLYIYTQRNYEAMLCYIHMFDAFLVSATKTHTGYIKCSHLCLNNKTHLSWALFAQRLHNTVATKTRLYAGFAFLRWTNGLRHDATPVCDFRCRRSGRKRGVTCNSPVSSPAVSPFFTQTSIYVCYFLHCQVRWNNNASPVCVRTFYTKQWGTITLNRLCCRGYGCKTYH